LAEICDGAVIIEHGRIIAAGTIDEIVHGSAGETEPRIKVQIKPLGPPEALHKAMLEMPHVDSADVVGDMVEAEIAGTIELTCDILAELIRRDFKILEFKQRRAQLEEIFMNVTRGEVS
jgi:ABC-2 type transport system ATP-binding protein